MTYISTYWDRAVIWASDYLPSWLYLEFLKAPGWAVAIAIASLGLAFFLVLRIMPKIKIEFDARDIQFVHQIGSEPRKIFRVKVSNMGTTAISCSGYLTSVTKNGINAGLVGPLPLTFAPGHAGDALRKLIQENIPAFLDIGYAAQEGLFFPATEFDPATKRLTMRTAEQHMFHDRGAYELQVVVTSDDAGSEKIKLLLNLTDDWHTTTIDPMRSRIGSLFSLCGGAHKAKPLTHS